MRRIWFCPDLPHKKFSALPLNFCNKKQEIEVGTWVAGIARFRNKLNILRFIS